MPVFSVRYGAKRTRSALVLVYSLATTKSSSPAEFGFRTCFSIPRAAFYCQRESEARRKSGYMLDSGTCSVWPWLELEVECFLPLHGLDLDSRRRRLVRSSSASFHLRQRHTGTMPLKTSGNSSDQSSASMQNSLASGRLCRYAFQTQSGA